MEGVELQNSASLSPSLSRWKTKIYRAMNPIRQALKAYYMYEKRIGPLKYLYFLYFVLHFVKNKLYFSLKTGTQLVHFIGCLRTDNCDHPTKVQIFILLFRKMLLILLKLRFHVHEAK